MAALTVVPADVALVDGTSMSKHVSRASEAITRGAVIRLVPATGKWALANGDTAAGAGNQRWFALHDVAAEEVLTGVHDCLLDVGSDTLDGLNFGVPIYLSDTVSTVNGLITAAIGESAEAVIVGYVVPMWSGPTVQRILRVL